ncbi:TPR repeat-containing thioredoxin TDX [Dendrobium catenatum]|uniref:TPR repeat-containing thioredoxin TDX n=1 Tax=Dendrobium catenatum TaxID=906689 RepID=A0A2I0VZ61_9ASPA|nr:TPR repeat-containing thioredoxin TDX [Dendrobium catenatum]
MDAAKVAQLRAFVGHCKSDPSVLHDPSLGFFRDYLESLGVQIPASSASKSHVKQESGGMPSTEFGDGNKPKQKTEDDDDEDEIVESDIELEGEVVEPDDDSPQKMGDPSVEVTEENRDAAQMSKAKAVDAISEGKFEDAIDYITEAITLNPTSAILYATRAKGYKSRGMAKALLGKWEEAAFDLHTASKLDHDEEIHSVLKMVEPNLQKIEEHHKKYERLKKEREQRKAERLRLRAEAVDRKAESEYLSVLQDGNVVGIHSSVELETKLKAATKLSRLAVLYFTAAWCGPCRSIAPVYKSLAERHPKTVFLKIDIDEVHNVAHQWNVSSVPTFFFVKDGKEIDKVVGADKTGLERKIALHSTKV